MKIPDILSEVDRLGKVEALCKEILLTLTLTHNQPNISAELQEIVEQWRKRGEKLEVNVL